MGAVQLGMPHKCYHGKTGRVFNVTKRAVGVVVNKQIRYEAQNSFKSIQYYSSTTQFQFRYQLTNSVVDTSLYLKI